MNIGDQIRSVKNEIAEACRRVGRAADDVTLLAITKNASDEAVQEALDGGITDLGENRIQNARRRLEKFPEARWHFVGTLQTNKVKYCSGFVLIHSLDRFRLAETLEKQAAVWARTIPVLVQINPGGEEQKSGLAVSQTALFVKQVHEQCPHLAVEGLMAMAPFADDPEDVRWVFRSVKQLQAKLQQQGYPVPILSMGMTNDFVVAVEEGSTLVRIGSALFREEVEHGESNGKSHGSFGTAGRRGV